MNIAPAPGGKPLRPLLCASLAIIHQNGSHDRARNETVDFRIQPFSRKVGRKQWGSIPHLFCGANVENGKFLAICQPFDEAVFGYSMYGHCISS
ncbi:hypothetical protein D3C72_1946990 [compost metagenome]